MEFLTENNFDYYEDGQKSSGKVSFRDNGYVNVNGEMATWMASSK